ncbi:MAG: hypothetical protein KC457_31560, partial [Myxococcales bacterium]|nr:hypothetical protein [Myxococcales bacterium]
MSADRRALSSVAGPVTTRGDRAFAFMLAAAMNAQSEDGEDDNDDGEDDDGDSETDDSLTHGFHAYPARMHPKLARVALTELRPGPDAEVLDPFCGSGTVIVEAMVAGWHALGSDLDPLALRLARVKSERRGSKQRARFIGRLDEVAAASSRRVRERVDVRAALSA